MKTVIEIYVQWSSVGAVYSVTAHNGVSVESLAKTWECVQVYTFIGQKFDVIVVPCVGMTEVMAKKLAIDVVNYEFKGSE